MLNSQTLESLKQNIGQESGNLSQEVLGKSDGKFHTSGQGDYRFWRRPISFFPFTKKNETLKKRNSKAKVKFSFLKEEKTSFIIVEIQAKNTARQLCSTLY